MKITSRQVKDFLAQPPAAIRAVLLHGSDQGMISERAKKLAQHYSDNIDDVFSVSRISSDMLNGETGLIADAAAAIPAFGGTRLVLVKGRGTELLENCKFALNGNLDGSMIIVEASGTTTKHAIVKLFETHKAAASIGCYADNVDDIRSLAKSIFSADNITISRDGLDLVVARLGNDRATSRGELEKLALLAGPGGGLTADDVAAALGDSALLAIDDIADAIAAGHASRLREALKKAWADEANAVTILRGCQSYFRHLGLAGHAMKQGQTAQNALRALRPPVHFKLQGRLQAQLRRWKPDQAIAVVGRLQDIELKVKSTGIDEAILTGQSLLGICLRAPR